MARCEHSLRGTAPDDEPTCRTLLRLRKSKWDFHAQGQEQPGNAEPRQTTTTASCADAIITRPSHSRPAATPRGAGVITGPNRALPVMRRTGVVMRVFDELVEVGARGGRAGSSVREVDVRADARRR